MLKSEQLDRLMGQSKAAVNIQRVESRKIEAKLLEHSEIPVEDTSGDL